ncbi:MAG: exo-alpha-sialidase [Rhodocyclales bacterium]|nr:exo-alpha-sialidase [Rhodocyclales bacterium]
MRWRNGWLCVSMALLPAMAMAQTHAEHQARAAEKPALAVGAALDGEGRLWLARVENRLLVVSHSTDGGRSFSPPVAVTPQPEAVTADAENRPKIAVGADGIVHVTWTQNLGKPMTGHIRYARSTDGGRSFSLPVILNDDRQVISHRFDALAVDDQRKSLWDGRGRVAVAWLDARGRSGRTANKSPQTDVGVYAALSQDGGARFAPNHRVADHSCQCCRTALTWTAAGPIAFWRHVFGRNIRDFAIADLNGGPVLRVTDDEWEIDGCPHHGGGIAVDGRGNLHIVWFTNGEKRKGIFHRRIAQTDFSKSASRLDMSAPLPLGDPARQAGHPAVVAQGDRVLLAWREFDGRRFSAWAMLSHDAGATWAPPRKLAEAAQQADYALPLVDAQQALVVWNTAAEGLRVLPVAEGRP